MIFTWASWAVSSDCALYAPIILPASVLASCSWWKLPTGISYQDEYGISEGILMMTIRFWLPPHLQVWWVWSGRTESLTLLEIASLLSCGFRHGSAICCSVRIGSLAVFWPNQRMNGCRSNPVYVPILLSIVSRGDYPQARTNTHKHRNVLLFFFIPHYLGSCHLYITFETTSDKSDYSFKRRL